MWKVSPLPLKQKDTLVQCSYGLLDICVEIIYANATWKK